MFVSRGRLNGEPKAEKSRQKLCFSKRPRCNLPCGLNSHTHKKCYRKNMVLSQAVITLKIYPVLPDITGLCFRPDMVLLVRGSPLGCLQLSEWWFFPPAWQATGKVCLATVSVWRGIWGESNVLKGLSSPLRLQSFLAAKKAIPFHLWREVIWPPWLPPGLTQKLDRGTGRLLTPCPVFAMCLRLPSLLFAPRSFPRTQPWVNNVVVMRLSGLNPVKASV